MTLGKSSFSGMQETEAVPVTDEGGNAGSVTLSFWRVSYARKKEVIVLFREEHRVIKRI